MCQEDVDCLPLDKACFPGLSWYDEPRRVVLSLQEDAPHAPGEPAGAAGGEEASLPEARPPSPLGLLTRLKALREELDEYLGTLAAISSSRTRNAERLRHWAAQALLKFGRLSK